MKRASNPTSWGGLLRGLPRAFDRKPMWAPINVTWQCNLSCGYGTEFDSGKGHAASSEVIARIDHCKELGLLHTPLSISPRAASMAAGWIARCAPPCPSPTGPGSLLTN